MERDIINRYVINFKRFIAPFTKEGVSIKTSIYPYTDGSIIVFEMDFNASGNTEYKSNSETMQEAMRKTQMFDHPEHATSISNTKLIWKDNIVVVIKSDKTSLWDEDAALSDVNNLISSIQKDGQR
ncbi:hypothetical protein [Bacteroides pyogenes]|uniref:hypothetical protein n=1 Tax=Bacteroides pyogenes TaxID=310300 RepID=UPI002FDA1C40